jgi:hypothetical protein
MSEQYTEAFAGGHVADHAFKDIETFPFEGSSITVGESGEIITFELDRDSWKARILRRTPVVDDLDTESRRYLDAHPDVEWVTVDRGAGWTMARGADGQKHTSTRIYDDE